MVTSFSFRTNAAHCGPSCSLIQDHLLRCLGFVAIYVIVDAKTSVPAAPLPVQYFVSL
jgi:hypothetical protein